MGTTGFPRRGRRTRELVTDGLAAAALFALSLLGSLLGADGLRGPLRLSAVVIAAVSRAAVPARRRLPRTVNPDTRVGCSERQNRRSGAT